MAFNYITNVLVHHPFLLLLIITLISTICIIVPFTYVTSYPQFFDPQMGFETRGTVLSNRITTWKNLVESTKYSEFAVNPKKLLKRKNSIRNTKHSKKKLRSKSQVLIHNETITDNKNQSYKETWSTLEKLVKDDQINFEIPHTNTEGFFCGPPDEGYAQIIYKSDNNNDLFNLRELFKLCRLEMELIQTKYYSNLCITKTLTISGQNKCCKPWSLANYIAALHDRTSCLGITEEDVNSTKQLIVDCSKYFHNLKLGPNCEEKGHCEVPRQCYRYDIVYNIFNYLSSMSFLQINGTNEFKLDETIIFLPLACSTAILPYYYELDDSELKYDGISAVAMEFGLKSTLFDRYLIRDFWLLSAGILSSSICIWMYTSSLFITSMTIIAIIFSLGISYFFYTIILNLDFFPFLNLLAIVVAVGIGVDHTFIFCKIFDTIKKENNSTLVKLMDETLYHALMSMFVTSFTTAAAFLSSYFSYITALRCFGVFAGTTVIVNYLLVITWLPACVAILEQHCGIMKTTSTCMSKLPRAQRLQFFISKWQTIYDGIDKLWKMPENIILHLILRFKIIIFLSLTALTFGSAVIVFYYPKLKLPNHNEFQLFDANHLFEQYDIVYKNKFLFKHAQKGNDMKNNYNYQLPMRFVWGVIPIDNGNYMNPKSLGTLKFNTHFNMSTPESQTWLLKFCRNLRKQAFYQSTLGPLLPNCFIESFLSWMQRRCFNSFDNIDRRPCCENSTFPYTVRVFDSCILDAIYDLYETPSEFFMPGMAGPKFSKDDTPIIKAIVVEYDSNYTYSMSYESMKVFVDQVDTWMAKQLINAPDNMRNGFFVTDYEFYDLQMALSKNTIYAFIISMSIALPCLFLSTLNVLITIFGIFTISCSIINCLALLVLFGWQINVLEAVAISTAIGLIFDFSLHYCVNYRVCSIKHNTNREKTVENTIRKMLGPTSMAALTTALAGLVMMPSQILAYKQIGQFLVTLMSVSWIYATFHLGSLLAIVGPENGFGQYYYSKIFSRSSRYSTKAASSVSDAHELDSLSSKCGISTQRVVRNLHKEFDGKRTNKKMSFSDQSPSANSAITVIVADDN